MTDGACTVSGHRFSFVSEHHIIFVSDDVVDVDHDFVGCVHTNITKLPGHRFSFVSGHRFSGAESSLLKGGFSRCASAPERTYTSDSKHSPAGAT